MSIKENIDTIEKTLKPDVRLVAVSKTKPVPMLQEAYDAGCRLFGENKAQEMAEKYDQLPHDIRWHMIGHLQTNKVKYIAPFVSLIESVDSLKVLKEINKQAAKNERVIDCLLQIHIADEENKFGLSAEEARELLASPEFASMHNVKVVGLMGLATYGAPDEKLHQEFGGLRVLFESLKAQESDRVAMHELSMGMSGDYALAMVEGSTMVRIGSAIFGARPPH